MAIDPKDLARWATRTAKRGVRAAVQTPPQPPAPPQPIRFQSSPQAWPAPQAPPQWAGPQRPIETDVLCRPGPSGYADLLSRVPDLAPNLAGDADAMAGRASPESAAAVLEAGAGSVAEPLVAYPRGALNTSSPQLNAASLPPEPKAN